MDNRSQLNKQVGKWWDDVIRGGRQATVTLSDCFSAGYEAGQQDLLDVNYASVRGAKDKHDENLIKDISNWPALGDGKDWLAQDRVSSLFRRCAITMGRLLKERGPDTGYDCCVCQQRIYSTFIGMGGGAGQEYAHKECYYRRRCEELEKENSALRNAEIRLKAERPPIPWSSSGKVPPEAEVIIAAVYGYAVAGVGGAEDLRASDRWILLQRVLERCWPGICEAWNVAKQKAGRGLL